eukprot:14627552-Alexandrium_andersonii.AAC.1
MLSPPRAPLACPTWLCARPTAHCSLDDPQQCNAGDATVGLRSARRELGYLRRSWGWHFGRSLRLSV